MVLGSDEWKSWLADKHDKYTREMPWAEPAKSQAAPPPEPPPQQPQKIDPRSVTTAEVFKMTNAERTQYLAALTGSDDRFGQPDVGPFRMLSVAEAREAGPLGRNQHWNAPKQGVPMPYVGKDGKPVELPENIKAGDVHTLTHEQRNALLVRAGMKPVAEQPINKPVGETGMFAGQRSADGGTVPGINSKR